MRWLISTTIGKSILASGLIIILSFVALRWLSRKPYFSLFISPITHLDRSQPQVMLSFDDGPSAEVTPPLLDLLSRHQIQAAFCVNGIHLEQQAEIARRIVREGHLLVNHTYAHDRMVWQSQDVIREDLEYTDRLIQALGQSEVSFYRPTYGDKFINLPLVLKQQNKQMLCWDVNPKAQYRGHFDQALVVSQVLEEVQNGSIILLHDCEQWATPQPAFLDAVEEIIERLQQSGFEFVLL